MRAYLFLFLFAGSITIAQAQLTKAELVVVSAIEDQLDENEALLKQIVNINSGTMNFDGVKEVGAVLSRKFQEIGFETAWEDGTSFNRAGHLIAIHEGKKNAPKILMIGHLDTVFELDHPLQSYREDGNTLHGPGVVDMKGGDVIIFAALQALHEAGALKNLNIRVVMTGDEEKSGKPLSASKKAIVDAAEWADLALGFENGDSKFETAVISRRGSIDWELRVTGTAAHSSQVFSDKVGDGAVYEISRILNAFREELSEEEYLTYNPGLILGGTDVEFASGTDGGKAAGKKNVVAQTALATGDIRAVSLEQLERAKAVMQQIVDNSLPGTSATIQFNEGYPPLGVTEGNKQLLALYSDISEDLGFEPVAAVHPIRAGAADISFTSGYVTGAMDGLGLSGGNDHTEQEFADMARFDDLIKRAAILLMRLQKEN